jgi:hypothetical protein
MPAPPPAGPPPAREPDYDLRSLHRLSL